MRAVHYNLYTNINPSIIKDENYYLQVFLILEI